MTVLRKYTATLALSGLALGGATVGAALAAFGPNAEGWQMAARYTARVSFLLFIAVYLTAPAARAFAWVAPLKRERRGLGLAFAAAHYIHLGALVTYFQVAGTTPSLLSVTLGGFAFVLIAIMAATSNDASVRALGPMNWRRLHTFGLHYVWFIFAATYARRIAANPDMPEYVILLALALAALVVRLGTTFTRKANAS